VSRSRPPYPPEFRAEAVRLVRSSGEPIPKVAAELGISAQTLRNWVFQAGVDAGENNGLKTDERARLAELERENRRLREERENRRLREERENRRLREERENLRKAAAFFATEPGRR